MQAAFEVIVVGGEEGGRLSPSTIAVVATTLLAARGAGGARPRIGDTGSRRSAASRRRHGGAVVVSRGGAGNMRVPSSCRWSGKQETRKVPPKPRRRVAAWRAWSVAEVRANRRVAAVRKGAHEIGGGGAQGRTRERVYGSRPAAARRTVR